MVPEVVFLWAMVLLPEAGGAFDTGMRFTSFGECEAVISAADVQVREGTYNREVMQQLVCLPAGEIDE